MNAFDSQSGWAGREDCSQLFQLVDRFDGAWHAGQRPAIDDFLPAGAERRAALIELIHVELECRLKAGEAVRVESYLERYPELADDAEVVLGLIAVEQEQRRRREPNLQAEEYLRRFPAYGPQLRLRGAAPPETLGWHAPVTPVGAGPHSSQTEIARPPLPPPSDALAQPLVAGYEILGELGRGGMGVVYKARHVKLHRLVALKMILAGSHASEEERARFVREAEAVARLQHPNVVQIYEIGQADGNPFFALEFVEGGSLDKKLGGVPLPAPEAAQLVETLARAVHAAHQRGIVHRDLKPANVLLTADGVPKITDFGLAKQLDGGGSQTQSGVVAGTPAYMAPEQTGGHGKAIGPAADVYALGALLYAGLTGRPPFKADTPLDTMLQVLSHDPVPPSRLQPQVPRDLETICLKCLAKEPGKRYASAAALAADLGRWRAGEPIEARPVGVLERTWKWARRRPAVAALVALLVLSGPGLLAVGLWRAAEVARHDQELRALGRRLQSQQQEIEDRGRQLRTHQYLLNIPRAQVYWDSGNVAQARALLRRHVPALGGEDLRDFEWFYLDRLCRASADQTLTKLDGGARRAVFSRDGLSLATAGGDGRIRLWDPRGRRLRRTLPGRVDPVEHLFFSPDGGRLIAVDQRGAVRVWDTGSGKDLPPPALPRRPVCAAASVDGAALVILTADGKVDCWQPATGQVRTWGREPGLRGTVRLAVLPDHQTLVNNTLDCWAGPGRWSWHFLLPDRKAIDLAASPDGRLVAAINRAGTIHLVRADRGTRLRDLPASGFRPRCLAFSPDSELLASGGDDTTVRLWEVGSGALRAVFKGHTGRVNSVAFAPDGRSLASAGQDGAVMLWPLDLRQDYQTLAVRLRATGPMAFSGDGQVLALARGGAVTLVRVASEETTTLACGTGPAILALALSPHGRLLATAHTDRTIRLWDVQGGREAAVLQGHAENAGGLAFSPDGSRLACRSARGVRLWEIANPRRPIDLRGPAAVLHVAFAPDGRTLATAGADHTVRLWELPRCTERAALPTAAAVTFLAWARDGRTLVAGGADGSLSRWRARQGGWQALPRLGLPGQGVALFSDGRTVAVHVHDHFLLWDLRTGKEVASVHSDPLAGAVFAPDGSALSTRGKDGVVRLTRLSRGRGCRPAGQALAPVCALAFSPDDRLLVTGTREPAMKYHYRSWIGSIHHRLVVGHSHDVRFWSAGSGQEMGVAGPSEPLGASALAFTPDGRTLVSAGAGGSVWVWDVAARRQKARWFINDRARLYWGLWRWNRNSRWGMDPRFNDSVQALALAPDGRTLATASNHGDVALWDLANGRRRLALPLVHEEVACLSFSPDGTLLAANHRHKVRLWEVPRRAGQAVRLKQTLSGRHEGPVVSLAFAPGGQVLATGGADNRVVLWDLSTGMGIHVLFGHQGPVQALAFTPDGHTLVSGGADGKVKLWHARSGQELLTLAGHQGPVRCLAVARHGRTLASGGTAPSGAGEVYIWQGTSGVTNR
jgi:WD40 repeat protein/tRNA A-37 threonylcarbamoyl transferase component Bud32